MVTTDDSGSSVVDARTERRDELNEAREQLDATNEILSLLAVSSSTAEDVFSAIVTRARRLCHADVAQVHMLHDNAFDMVRSDGHSPEYLDLAAHRSIARDRNSLIGRVALDHRAQQITDVLADPEYDVPQLQEVGRYRTILGAPMVVHGDVVGVVTVWRTVVAPFDERAIRLLRTFAAQGALALRTVELLRSLDAKSADLARRVDQLEALAEVGEAVSSSLNADELLTTIVTLAVELSGTDGGSLMEYDEATQLFGVRTTFGTSPAVVEALRNSRIHLDETVVGRACRERRPTQIPDLAAVERDPHLTVLYDAGWRSLVAIPMIRADRVVGAMVVRRLSVGDFSDETCDILETFASQSAIALTNARLYQQLERQSAELAQASQHKSEFLASMSHELRTPLNAVIGFSEVLLERMFGDLNARQEDYLRDILASGRHLLALLNDVLDLSKVEAGQMELDLSTFSGRDAITYSVSMVRERAMNHGITMRTLVEDDVGDIVADELRFKQILLNLLSNAVKFTPDGGTVEVLAHRDDDDLVVTVRDTGVGIAAEDQERIFDSFQQGSRAAPQIEGTGLGLTLTRRIVELHGGSMWLRSAPGEGSTFGFTLPGAVLARRVHEVTAAVDAQDPRPTVVVIEDDARSAELIAVQLEATGLRTVTARTGEEGLELVRDLAPVAVILDIHLPGMDGWDVLAALKEDPATAAVPVVVVSVIPDRSRGFALGASDYLVKPVARDGLLTALRRLLPLPVEHTPRRVVVCLDDDEVALELVRLTLEPVGWVVHTCVTADDAYRVIREARPAVVIVDLLMPRTDGFAVIDTLRAGEDTANLPIVVLTAKDLTARDRALLEGRIEFVASKSAVDLRLLADRLARVSSSAGAPGEVG
jgi:signal transduction histidine kinase/DNA-binding response OmpR family regulator